jgi:inner membrane protein
MRRGEHGPFHSYGEPMKKLLSSSIVVKVLVLAFLILAAMVPLERIGSLIGERGAMKQNAAHELAGSYAGSQTLAGPMLVVPWTERWVEVKHDENGKVVDRIARSATHVKLVFPERLRLRGELTPDKRYRGIFTVLFYGLKGRIDGQFAPFDPSTIHGDIAGSTVEVGTPVLALSMGDVRGLQGAPRLNIAGDAATFLPRVPGLDDDNWIFQSVHAPLPAAALRAWSGRQAMEFQLDLTLMGQSRLAIVPLGGETTAHLTSSWPHPSFGGSFLATQRVVSERGFEADWAVSSLATSARAQLSRLAATPSKQAMPAVGAIESFDVGLIEPLDVYALTGRAVKYGLLFVALTLMAAFMFELLRHLRLHAIQYGLVALAISLFFLLLLALSEKIAFGLAYLIATAACVLLLTVYFSAVLGGARRGLGLGLYVGLLYASLYGLLLSEDNALLLGSVLLFGLLAFLMIATRKVDWYGLSAPSAAASK